MAVTVKDVRNQLNGITEEELISETIELEIQSAVRKADDIGMPAGDSRDEFIRRWAAYNSYLQSPLLTRIEIHDIEAQIAIKEKIKRLKEQADDALEDAMAGDYEIDSTPMFDERPEDPDEPCNWPRTR